MSFAFDVISRRLKSPIPRYRTPMLAGLWAGKDFYVLVFIQMDSETSAVHFFMVH
jgi:hypothetical protein